MASALLRGARQFPPAMWRGFAMVATGVDIVAAAPGVALQKARTWDEGVSSNFSTTPLKELFLVSLFSLFPISLCLVHIQSNRSYYSLC
jgi:hypothetical protein